MDQQLPLQGRSKFYDKYYATSLLEADIFRMDERDLPAVCPAGGRGSKTPESPGAILKINVSCIFKI